MRARNVCRPHPGRLAPAARAPARPPRAQVDLRPHEILYKVRIPYTRQYEYVKEFKQSPRREDDIAIVNAGMSVRLAPGGAEGGWLVEEASVAFGGVAARAIMAPAVAAALVGRPWDQATLQVRARARACTRVLKSHFCACA